MPVERRMKIECESKNEMNLSTAFIRYDNIIYILSFKLVSSGLEVH